MAGVRWGSLVAGTDGEIDYARVRSLASVALALLGGGVMITAALVEVFKLASVPTTHVVISGAALVAPLTGGKIADSFTGRSRSAAIRAGRAPGRRSTDPQRTVDGGGT